MKNMIAVATAILADCPHCGAGLLTESGSYMITSDSFPKNVATCYECGEQSKLPAVARVFV